MKAEPGSRVRFRILGPLEICSEGEWTAVSAPKCRSLLACLLLRPGHLYSTESLILELWGDRTPSSASSLVSTYVHRLRQLIGDPEGRVLVSQAPGYLLRISPSDVDLQEFEVLIANGRRALLAGDPEQAAALPTEALELWRGPLLADVSPTVLITMEAERATELRLAAAELRIEAGLACRRASEVIPELRKLVAEHPVRERLWLLLMRALSEAGRNAEALDTYTQARQAISSELGVGPGAELRRQHAQLLAADASGAVTHTGSTARPASAAASRIPAASARPEDITGREDFGRALDAVRGRARLTVQEVAWAAGVSPGEAAGYFAGKDLPVLGEAGLKTLHSILAACGIMDPEQVITWTYALVRAWSVSGHQPPVGAEHPSEETAGQAHALSPRTFPDARGFDLCPDPLSAQTAPDLVAMLSRFRLWAGEPSFREMERLSRPRVAAATMCTALGGSNLPSLRVVLAIVTGCGGTPEHQQAFTTAWRKIRMTRNPRSPAGNTVS